MTGGLVVFGKNTTTNDTFVRVLTGAQSSIEEELTVGTWDLGAMGWDGSSHMTGSVFCAQQAATSVTTGPVVFNLSLSNAACFGSSISPETGTSGSGGNQKFAPIYNVAFCSDDLASLAAPCTYTFGEPSNTKVPVGSYSIDVTGVKSYKGVQEIIPTEYLRSYCFNAETHMDLASESVQSLNIPRFNPGSGLSFRVVAHMSNDCSSAINMGQIAIPFRDTVNFKAFQSMSYEKKFVGKITIDQVCSISNQLNITEGVASGTGDPANPYVICNVNQFYTLQREFNSYYNKSFILGKDIDLLYGIKAGSVGANPFHECLDDGDTFIPIGYEATVTTPGSCDFSLSMYSFLGNFDGNNKTIKNFRFKNSELLQVGLFARKTDGGIVDLTMEKVDIEAGDMTAALAGAVYGTPIFKNIKIKNLHLRGKDISGGVFGNAAGGTYDNIQVVGANLRAEGSQFGGIIGTLYAPPIPSVSKLSFDGHIDVDGSSVIRVGGLIGYSNSPITESNSTGSITGQMSRVGGIIGELYGAQTVTYVKSDMLIFDRDGLNNIQRDFGGIIGSGSDAIVDRSIFYGDISSACIDPICKIGSIIGSTSTTAPTLTLSLKEFSAGGEDGTALLDLQAVYNGTSLSTLCSGMDPCPWSQSPSNVSAPMLSHESNICSSDINNESIYAQRNNGRGSATNPFIICQPSQFEQVDELSASEYVKLASNINLFDYNSSATALNQNPFVGKFDGQDRMIHSLNSINTNEGGIFGNISSSAVVKNLVLKNINIANCATCKLGTLSSVNNGEIYNVRVHDSYLAGTAALPEFGGLVSENTNLGKIINSEVNVNIVANTQIGGVVFKNSGLIELVDSRSRIDIASGSGEKIGGIVGQLEVTGKIRKSEFGGEILIAGTPSKVGGIAGIAMRGATLAAEMTDVSVTSDAFISLPNSGGSSFIAGVLGLASGSGANVNIQRAIFSGSLVIPKANSITSVGGIIPASMTGANVVSSKMLVSPLKGLELIYTIGTETHDPGTGACTFTLTTNAPAEEYDGPGGIKYQYGEMKLVNIDSLSTTSFAITAMVDDYNECESFTIGYAANSASLYKQSGVPDTLSVSGMKSEGFDIVDMDNDSTDAERMYTNYLAFLQGTNPPSPPVWEMDEGEPRIFVFDK